MNIKIIIFVDEIEIQYNKRALSYFDTGYSYWYNGREKINNSYPSKKWEKVLKKHTNNHCACIIEYNEKYDCEQARLFDELIRQSILKDKASEVE